MITPHEYTPPMELDGGTIEIDTTPDFDGDIEITNRDGDHIVYLKPADQIALRDLLNRIHPVVTP